MEKPDTLFTFNQYQARLTIITQGFDKFSIYSKRNLSIGERESLLENIKINDIKER